MTIRKHPVFAAVVEAMQSAEELGGCEVEDYAPLMQAIEAEARTRRLVFVRVQREGQSGRDARGSGRLLLGAVFLSWLAVIGAVDVVRAVAGWFGGAP
jgi:hypothetical protein